MKGSSVAAGALLAASASATNGVFQMDVARRSPHPRAARRATSSTDSTTVINNQTQGGYFVQTKIGSPAQSLTLQLDTGSSDIWVPASSATVCTTSSDTAPNGCDLGSFDSSASSTYTVVDRDGFSISYVDNSYAKGDYFTDVFQIGGSSLKNVTMGLGRDTDIGFGLVGIGYATNEAIVSTEQSLSAAYNNLPVMMVQDGIINTNAYSLWLNDLDASSGNLLFGGIDTAKYKGDLTVIDIYEDSNTGTYSSFIVALTSLGASSPSGNDTLTSTEFPVSAVLDSGTTLTYVPQDLAEEVWKEAGAAYDADAGVALIPCSMQTSAGVFSFGFGGSSGPIITVGMDELVLDIPTTNGLPYIFPSGTHKGEDACEFGIQNQTGAPYLLGDTFLRSAYVVYDLENNQIAIAPTDFNTTDSNVVAFASSGAPIPSATTAPGQSAVTASSTVEATEPAYAASSGFAHSTATATGSSSGSSSGSGSGSSSSASASSSQNAGASLAPGMSMDVVRVGFVSAALFMIGGMLML